MARIETVDHHYTKDDGTKAVEKIAYEVNREGVFRCALPEWLESLVEFELSRGVSQAMYGDTRTAETREKKRIESSQLAHIKLLINKVLKDYSEPEVTGEVVIRYSHKSLAAVVETPDGRLFPNGSASTAATGKDWSDPASGTWAEELPLNATNYANGGYSIRCGAKVMIKETTRRGTFTKHRYARYTGSAESALRLNQFVGFILENEIGIVDGVDIKEMPYSDEAAEFFYSIMMGMASMALKIERFFRNEQLMLETIKSGAMLLPKLD